MTSVGQQVGGLLHTYAVSMSPLCVLNLILGLVVAKKLEERTLLLYHKTLFPHTFHTLLSQRILTLCTPIMALISFLLNIFREDLFICVLS